MKLKLKVEVWSWSWSLWLSELIAAAKDSWACSEKNAERLKDHNYVTANACFLTLIDFYYAYNNKFLNEKYLKRPLEILLSTKTFLFNRNHLGTFFHGNNKQAGAELYILSRSISTHFISFGISQHWLFHSQQRCCEGKHPCSNDPIIFLISVMYFFHSKCP